jgi:hypothetical protein
MPLEACGVYVHSGKRVHIRILESGEEYMKDTCCLELCKQHRMVFASLANKKGHTRMHAQDEN